MRPWMSIALRGQSPRPRVKDDVVESAHVDGPWPLASVASPLSHCLGDAARRDRWRDVVPHRPGVFVLRFTVFAGWLIAGYVLLETLPWTRGILHLGVPHRGTIALCAMGLAIALVVAGAASRWRAEAAATDTVS